MIDVSTMTAADLHNEMANCEAAGARWASVISREWERRLRAAEAERDELDRSESELIAERDSMEERINLICRALRLSEAESEWSSANDPAIRAIDKAEALIAERDAARAEVARLREAADGAYSERDKLVCALSKVFPSWLARHPDGETWDDDWRWIVFVQLPTGQASWHIHDSERDWFNHLQVGENCWDGHTNDEKYARVAALAAQPEPGAAQEEQAT